MIETEGLTRQFDETTIVDHLTLSIAKGALFGFLGRNGAGKTTTMKMLSTVLRPSSGAALIGGHDVQREAKEVRRLIGVVGEGVEATRPFWTPVDYLSFFLGLHGLGRRQSAEVARGWLERLDLADHRDRPIGDFSSGMRKRLELCRALSHDPDVLLLDEPTKDLDIPGKRAMWDLVRGLSRETGTTVFVCSHEATEIQTLCREIAVIRSGKLGFLGAVDTLPDPVLKITGMASKELASLADRLPVLSYSSVGISLYVAFKEKVPVDELTAAVGSKGRIVGIEPVHSFDERILAFL